jgi:hypothetical protein
MPIIKTRTTLGKVEHIVGSGTGILDFAVAEKDDYYTWNGTEDAEWTVKDVDYVENIEEDRFILYPEGDYFTCKIEADNEEFNEGTVVCQC